MNSRKEFQFGDFTVFGFTRDPNFINQNLVARLEITPKIIEIGTLGQFYFYTTYGDVAESEDSLVLKLGFLRSKAKSALNARQLLEQKLVSPRSIDSDGFSGNGLVVGLSKTEPVFSVFQTFLGMPQLYYSVLADGIICSDMLRCVVKLIPRRELNDAILPQHFIFQNVYGASTYFRNISRLLPGYYLKWFNGSIESNLRRSLDVVANYSQYIRNDERALSLLSDSFEQIVGDYITQIEKSGHGHVNQLSGGVDSTLLQSFINPKSNHSPNKSISYVIQVPSFEYEVEYAQQASQLLHTDHTFVKYAPEDYPGLLTRVIDILAQPPNHETTPSLLAIAEFIRSENWSERYFFTGHGSDTLFGFSDASKLKALEMIQRIPFAATWLKGLGLFLSPAKRLSRSLLKGSEIIASQNNPDSLVARSNNLLTYDVDWGLVQRSFGDSVIRETLANRRKFPLQYSKSDHYLDKVNFIELLTFTYDLSVKNQQLALTHRMEQVFPFFDEDLLKLALTIHPDIRYIKGFKYKHLMRRLLERRTNAPVAHKSKGVSTVNEEFVIWMRSGPLRPLIDDIQRPGFLSKPDFDHMIQTPNYFLLSLLTFDLFNKNVINGNFG